MRDERFAELLLAAEDQPLQRVVDVRRWAPQGVLNLQFPFWLRPAFYRGDHYLAFETSRGIRVLRVRHGSTESVGTLRVEFMTGAFGFAMHENGRDAALLVQESKPRDPKEIEIGDDGEPLPQSRSTGSWHVYPGAFAGHAGGHQRLVGLPARGEGLRRSACLGERSSYWAMHSSTILCQIASPQCSAPAAFG